MKEKMSTNVESHVVPAIAGIQSADKATAVLYQLATSEQLDPKDAQRAIDLAQQALALALNRAEALDGMRGISDNAQNQAERAKVALREARATLRTVDKQVGTKKLSLEKAEQLQAHANEIHEDLSKAEAAMESIAKAYDVPVDLEFRG